MNVKLLLYILMIMVLAISVNGVLEGDISTGINNTFIATQILVSGGSVNGSDININVGNFSVVNTTTLNATSISGLLDWIWLYNIPFLVGEWNTDLDNNVSMLRKELLDNITDVRKSIILNITDVRNSILLNESDNIINGSDVNFNNVTSLWYDWKILTGVSQEYLLFDGHELSYLESKLNATIDNKISATFQTFLPTNISVIIGTVDVGTLEALFSFGDDLHYNVTEIVSSPAWNIIINFSTITANYNKILLNTMYTGNDVHGVDVKLYNYETNTYDLFCNIPDMVDFDFIECSVFNSTPYINGTNSSLQAIHDNIGNPNHVISFDQVVLQLDTSGVAISNCAVDKSCSAITYDSESSSHLNNNTHILASVLNSTGDLEVTDNALIGGTLGIGEITPDRQLHITDSANVGLKIEATTDNIAVLQLLNTDGDIFIGKENSGGGNLAINSIANAGIISVATTDSLQLCVQNNCNIGLTLNSVGSIDVSGNAVIDGMVGIGTVPSNYQTVIDGLTRNNILNVSSSDNRAVLAISDNDAHGFIVAEGNSISIGGSPQRTTTNFNIELDTGFATIGSLAPDTNVMFQMEGIFPTSDSTLRIENSYLQDGDLNGGTQIQFALATRNAGWITISKEEDYSSNPERTAIMDIDIEVDDSRTDIIQFDRTGTTFESGNLFLIDNMFIGLGSSKGHIEFDDQATDEVNILNANVGIGDSTPSSKLDVAGTIKGTIVCGGYATVLTSSGSAVDTGDEIATLFTSMETEGKTYSCVDCFTVLGGGADCTTSIARTYCELKITC